MTRKIDRLDWLFLDALADNYQSLEIITPDVLEIETWADEDVVNDRLVHLLELGLVETMEEEASWYGMTAKGYQAWEEFSTVYSDGPVDWTKSYALFLNYEESRGYVIGTTREICERALMKNVDELQIRVDPDSLQHSTIDGFWAKYYKLLLGGYRYDFGFEGETPRRGSMELVSRTVTPTSRLS